jgi:hypothetical protein
MSKNYTLKIFEKKDGSTNQKLIKEIFSSATSKQQAFIDAKQALFEFAQNDFPNSQILESLENEFNEAKKNDKKGFTFELEDFLNHFNHYAFGTLVKADDVGNFNADCFKFGQLSYSFDVYHYEIKVFSKKSK